jgi:hypothetical protein
MPDKNVRQPEMFTLIRSCQQLGQSKKNFCEEKEITYSNVHYWYK